MSLTVAETAPVAVPREGRVLLVAAGAAFLALLDTRSPTSRWPTCAATSPAPPSAPPAG